MIWTDVTRWTGDVIDRKMRDRLQVRKDVIWRDGEPQFNGIDREWLLSIKVQS